MVRATVIGEVVLDRVITQAGATDVAGGSAANMALALSRAGHDVEFRARYSIDDAGRFLKATATNNGLDIRHSVDAPEPATVVEIHLDASGVPTYDFQMDGTADWQWTHSDLSAPLPAQTDVIVVGSLATVEEPGSTVLQQWTSEHQLHGIALAYDPNARPSSIRSESHADEVRAVMHRWVRLSDIVKVSDEDLAWYAPHREATDVAKEWSTEGARIVVVTRGAHGAAAYRDGEFLCEVPGVQVEVVDTVGAGDTFMAWLLIGLFENDERNRYTAINVERTLTRATIAAALNCQSAGCQPPSEHSVKKAELDLRG